MDTSDYKNDPKLLDELFHVRAENASLFNEINFIKEQNDFLRRIIDTLISARNA